MMGIKIYTHAVSVSLNLIMASMNPLSKGVLKYIYI